MLQQSLWRIIVSGAALVWGVTDPGKAHRTTLSNGGPDQKFAASTRCGWALPFFCLVAYLFPEDLYV